MSSQGPLNGATAADDATVGAVSLSNMANALLSDGSFASAILLLGQVTHYLKVTNFGFTIPSDATIDGVFAEIQRNATVSIAMTDNSVKLVKGGSISGSEKARSTQWPTASAYQTYGGATDLWGLTLTPADVNLSTFGIVISAVAGISATANIDHIRLTVYWTGSNRPGNTGPYLRVGNSTSRNEVSS
jgi:hypothetical protein